MSYHRGNRSSRKEEEPWGDSGERCKTHLCPPTHHSYLPSPPSLLPHPSTDPSSPALLHPFCPLSLSLSPLCWSVFSPFLQGRETGMCHLLQVIISATTGCSFSLYSQSREAFEQAQFGFGEYTRSYYLRSKASLIVVKTIAPVVSLCLECWIRVQVGFTQKKTGIFQN